MWVACTSDGQVVGLDALCDGSRSGLTSADAVGADGDFVYVVGQQGPTEGKLLYDVPLAMLGG